MVSSGQVRKFFNTAGPNQPDIHYTLPPLERWDLAELLGLIRERKYFVLHAPRQTGKTSCMLALRDFLNNGSDYFCVYANVEVGQSARENVDAAMRAILSSLATSAIALGSSLPRERAPALLAEAGGHDALRRLLTEWAGATAKPIVLLLDEVDALVGDTLISLLRQLRAGYPQRPQQFPQSVILCGVRDVRDYRIHSSAEQAIITGGSAFNIKVKSLRLEDFTRQDLVALYQQHADTTGQIFEPATLDLAWELTQGQPWLVNALAYEACFEMKENRDRSRPITLAILEQAKENLILRRETHLDQLVDKLQEERVRRVIEPILAGRDIEEGLHTDDLQYVADLGLITLAGGTRIANAIYQEVIPRELVYPTQAMLSQQTAWYVKPDGTLDMAKLLEAFQQFFQQNSASWIERFQYKETAPQLLLQAFLQRIINSGGLVDREYGLGRGRIDLFLRWPYPGGEQRIVLELKILYQSLEQTLPIGLPQTWRYMEQCRADEGHLVIFDRDPERPWSEKIFHRQEQWEGHAIQVWGM